MNQNEPTNTTLANTNESIWQRLQLTWTSYTFLILYSWLLVYNFMQSLGSDEYGWLVIGLELPAHLLLLVAIFIRALMKRKHLLKYLLYTLYVIVGFCATARYLLPHWYGWW